MTIINDGHNAKKWANDAPAEPFSQKTYDLYHTYMDLLDKFVLNSAQRAAIFNAIDLAPRIDDETVDDIARHPANRDRVKAYRKAAEIPLIAAASKERSGDLLDRAKTLDDLLGERRLASWEQIISALGKHARG